MAKAIVAGDGDQLRRLEIMSGAEASTLMLLLGLAVPLKHLAGWSLGVRVLGPIHGLAFIAFAWTALESIAADPSTWTLRERVRLFLGALLPFGGFLNIALIRRKADAARRRAPAE